MTASSEPARRRQKGEVYTNDELMARLKFFIGVCLTLTLMGIIFTILYSVIFVTQPLKSIAPIDQKFFEVIIPVASFLCGILSGIMLNGTNQSALDAVQKTMATFKETSAQAGKVAAPAPVSYSPPPTAHSSPGRTEPQLEPMSATVVSGFHGKPAPPPVHDPEI